jgi:hypothetical protein
MIPDISTGDFTRMFCLNCARKIVSPTPTTKYGALTRYLKFRASFTDTVKLPFAKMDGIIGDNLPMSAYRTEKWWSNLSTNVHAKAWLDAGWEASEVNLKEGYVVFKRVKGVQAKGGRRRASRNEVKKPFTPARVRIPKRSKPSKTRVSKLYARLKNLERQKASMPKYPGSFKPKPKHEKSLFKLDKRPQ